MILNNLAVEVGQQLSRILTGQLLTKEQIEVVTRHSIGRYFSDFFPEPEELQNAAERVEEAELHIRKATDIVVALQSELQARSASLRTLITDIEEKQQMADRYAALAQTSQAQFAALKTELEEVVRRELIERDRKGRRIRQLASFVIWLFTLIIGAAAGAYFLEVASWFGIQPPGVR